MHASLSCAREVPRWGNLGGGFVCLAFLGELCGKNSIRMYNTMSFRSLVVGHDGVRSGGHGWRCLSRGPLYIVQTACPHGSVGACYARGERLECSYTLGGQGWYLRVTSCIVICFAPCFPASFLFWYRCEVVVGKGGAINRTGVRGATST